MHLKRGRVLALFTLASFVPFQRLLFGAQRTQEEYFPPTHRLMLVSKPPSNLDEDGATFSPRAVSLPANGATEPGGGGGGGDLHRTGRIRTHLCLALHATTGWAGLDSRTKTRTGVSMQRHMAGRSNLARAVFCSDAPLASFGLRYGDVIDVIEKLVPLSFLLRRTSCPVALYDPQASFTSSALAWNCHCPFVARHSFTFCYCRLVHCHLRSSACLFSTLHLSVAPLLPGAYRTRPSSSTQ
ncbi:hypothetical protein LY78DRAFT_235386 [Colletotrichum sublineola]|nr:hypothetical protein LY78DRAFT_235386 [Colletotrichum sublineola]